jgi:hypothetical protein
MRCERRLLCSLCLDRVFIWLQQMKAERAVEGYMSRLRLGLIELSECTISSYWQNTLLQTSWTLV